MPKGEICVSCLYGDAPAEAQSMYDTQPSLTVSYDVGEATYDVNRQIDPEVKAKMIKDPTAATQELNSYLQTSPCDFVKTGRCAVADYAVIRLLNQPI